MIRTKILPCELNRSEADALNLASGRIYTKVLVSHWRIMRKKNIWLSEKAGTRLSDYQTSASLHAHTIDAAQQGFYKACKTAKALKKIDPNAKYPHWTKKFRTTTWKNTAIKKDGNTVTLSNGRGNSPIMIRLTDDLANALKILEVRLVFSKRSRKYEWHIVAETGKQPKQPTGDGIISVDLGKIHPVVVGDGHSAVIVTCRKRRHQAQGHAKRLASISRAMSKKKKGSRRYEKLKRAKNRMKAHNKAVMRDIEHKVSREIVNIAVEKQAAKIVIGDIREIADEVNLGKNTNQKISGWNHGKIREYVTYKAEEFGISIALQNERYTSQTCPNCGHRHKPKGRNYKCPSCAFQSHRDVVGQINILSAYKFGEPGKIPAPTEVKHRMPYNIRLMRRRTDTPQTLSL